MSSTVRTSSKTFYVDSSCGSDDNSGVTIGEPWRTLGKISSYHSETPLNPGDKILLKSGSFFEETLMLKGLHGTKTNPIKLSCYNTSSTQRFNRPILSSFPKRQQCIQFKDCSFIQIENLEIRQGKVYFTFGNLANQTTTKTIFSSFSIKNIYMHNIYSGDSSKASIEFNVLGKNIVIKDIKIENCEFEGIACHAILLNTSHLLQPDNDEAHFKNITITSNKIRNTSSTALVLNYVDKGFIEKNVIINAGKFLTSTTSTTSTTSNKGGSSGIAIDSCSNINIIKNKIRSCFGETRSTALCLLKNNRSILLKHNICRDNSGGFISIFGGNANISIINNVSFNDGIRNKQMSSLVSAPGRTVTITDFSKWSYRENQNIYNNTTKINITKNVFATTFFNKAVAFALFGKHNQIHIDENTVICKLPNAVEIITNNIIENLFVKNNTSNVPWKIPNQQNLTITNNETKKFKISTELPNDVTFDDSLFIFLEKIQNDNLTHDSLYLLDLFEKHEILCDFKNKRLTNKTKPSLFCMFCYAPRKALSLMEHLAVNDQIIFLNERLAREFKTSQQEITSWFSDPSRILLNNTAKQLLKLIDESEHRALMSLLQYISLTIKEDSVLLLRDFVMYGPEIFNYFHEETNNFLEINSVFLVDNIYDDIKVNLTKQMESELPEENKHFNINQYVLHWLMREFSQIETLVSLLYIQSGVDRFFPVDLQQNILFPTFNSFWKILSHLCPIKFKRLFKQLSQFKYTTQNFIFDEGYVDSVILPHISNEVKQKSEPTKNINIQLQAEKDPLLHFKKEVVDICNTHRLNLEHLGAFNYFGNTAFFFKEAGVVSDYIKTNYYKFNLQLAAKSTITNT